MRNLALALVMISSVILSLTTQAAPQATLFKVTGTGVIKHVSDGDTFIIATQDMGPVQKMYSFTTDQKQRRHFKGNTFKTRLANVDTAESNHVDAKRNSYEGKMISNTVRQALTSKSVQYTCFNFGYYGRPICSVSILIKGQHVDVGEWLITNKMSNYITKWGTHPWLHRDYKNAMRNR